MSIQLTGNVRNARVGAQIVNDGLVFYYDPLHPNTVTESLWYDIFSDASGSFSASSFTSSYFYMDNQSIFINSTNSFNPYKNDYTYCLWIKPHQRNAVIFDKDRHFRLFLTNTNQIQVSIFPTDNFYGINGIHASGSYLYCINSAGNNNYTFLRYNTSDLKLDFARWQEISNFDNLNTSYPYCLNSNGDQICYSGYRGIGEFTGSSFSERTVGTRQTVSTGIGPPETAINDARGVDMDADNYYFSDEDNHRVVQRQRIGFAYVTHSGTGGGAGDLQYSSPKGVCIDDDYVYVCDYNNHRIKKLNIADLSLDIMTGSLGDGDGQFRSPYGIDCDDTHLYIGEYNSNRITKLLKSDLSFVARTGSNAVDNSADHYLNNVTYISVNGDDLFVVSSHDKKIKKFSSADFSYKNAVVSGSDNLSETGKFYAAKTSQIGTDGFIHVIDRSRYYRKFQPISGNLIVAGTKNFIGNDSYALQQSGGFYFVANTDGYTVNLYDSDWALVTQSGDGAAGSGELEYNKPRGICYDDDYVYVTDDINDRIKKLNKADLTYVTQSGGVINTPYGMQHRDGLLYIQSYYDDKIWIMSASDLSFVDSFTVANPYYCIGIEEDYLYSYRRNGLYGISKYLRASPYTEIASYIMEYGDDPNERSTFYDIGVGDEYLYVANNYSFLVLDKETLGFVNKLDWNEHNFVGKKLGYNPTGSWLNIVVTLGQISASLYVNAELHASHSYTASADATMRNDFSSNSPFIFGTYRKTGLHTTESVGMISGYNRILTDAEIQENYYAMKNSRFYK